MDDELPQKILAYIKARGISARALSLQAGLNPTAVRDIVNGKSKNPRFETLNNIAKSLQISLHEMLPQSHRTRLMEEAIIDGERYKLVKELKIRFGDKAKNAGVVVLGDFRSKDFSGASFIGTKFIGADLRDASFKGANLSYADFTGCDLRGTDMTDAIFDHTILVDADFRGANLSGVDLTKAIFTRDPKD